MRILGVSCFVPSASAVLVVDGRIVAASAEERFSGRPADHSFPEQALRFCLDQSRLAGATGPIDRVACVTPPQRRSGGGLADVRRAVAGWTDTLSLRRRLRQVAGVGADDIIYVDLHRALAAGAYFSSPFEGAAVLVADDLEGTPVTIAGEGTNGRLDVGGRAEQALTPEVVARIAGDLVRASGVGAVALAGSAVLDGHVVEALARVPGIEQVFAHPAPSAGVAAAGAALDVFMAAAKRPAARAMRHAYTGLSIETRTAIEAASASGLVWAECDEEELLGRTSQLLGLGQLVGWAQEEAEWSTHPLGHRAVLSTPIDPEALARLRAVADDGAEALTLAVPAARAAEFFDIDLNAARLSADVGTLTAAVAAGAPGLAALAGQPMRVYAVDAATNPRFGALLARMEDVTGTPALALAPFRHPGGGPLVNSAADAVAAASVAKLDALVLDLIVMLLE